MSRAPGKRSSGSLQVGFREKRSQSPEGDRTVASSPGTPAPFNNAALSAKLEEQACIYCGQDLTGLKAGDVCPGCGKLALHSLLGNNLRDADSGWLRTVMLGLFIAAVSVPALALAYALRVAESLDRGGVQSDLSVIHGVVTFLAWTGLTIGLFNATDAETSGALIARRRGLVWLMRLALVVVTIVDAVPRRAILSSAGELALLAVDYATIIGAPLAFLLMWVCLKRIIDRTPRREVGRWLMVGMIVSPLVMFAAARGMDARWVAFVPAAAQLHVVVAINALAAIHALAASFLLLRTRGAMRRTVGFWD